MTLQAFVALFAVLMPVWVCVTLARSNRRRQQTRIRTSSALTKRLRSGVGGCAKPPLAVRSHLRDIPISGSTDASQTGNHSEYGGRVTSDPRATIRGGWARAHRLTEKEKETIILALVEFSLSNDAPQYGEEVPLEAYTLAERFRRGETVYGAPPRPAQKVNAGTVIDFPAPDRGPSATR